MIQVSYISAARSPLSTDDLARLLDDCRDYNAEHDITGMLLYSHETFVQILEGEEAEIDALLKRIKKDARHGDIRMLDRKPIAEREYARWSMGFRRLADTEFRNIPGLEDFSAENFNPAFLGSNASVVDSLMKHFRRQRLRSIGQDELSLEESDQLIKTLHMLIRGAVRVLAVLMVLTIFWGVLDVVYAIYTKVLAPSLQDFRARDIIVTFGAFLTVLIAIEIFMNITLYLRDDVIHIRLVISTALMAIARKVIILDFEKVDFMYMFATATVVLALGITYWLVGDRTLFGKSGPRWAPME